MRIEINDLPADIEPMLDFFTALAVSNTHAVHVEVNWDEDVDIVGVPVEIDRNRGLVVVHGEDGDIWSIKVVDILEVLVLPRG